MKHIAGNISPGTLIMPIADKKSRALQNDPNEATCEIIHQRDLEAGVFQLDIPKLILRLPYTDESLVAHDIIFSQIFMCCRGQTIRLRTDH